MTERKIDYDRMKAETYWAYSDLQSKHSLPEMAAVDFQFIPSGLFPRWTHFKKDIERLGFTAKRYGRTFEVQTRPLFLSAETIWEHEKMLAEIGSRHGFMADGWGFMYEP